MPPKVKVTREDIAWTAFDIVRLEGMDALNVRNIAARLGCSTQPIFSNFENMDQLKLQVVQMAEEHYKLYAKIQMQDTDVPLYKANGMAYIRFAKDEKHLFHLLYMRNRKEEEVSKSNELFDSMAEIVMQNLGFTREQAMFFHLEIWAFVHGIATMIATNYYEPDWDLISRMTSDIYTGLRLKYQKENENGCH